MFYNSSIILAPSSVWISSPNYLILGWDFICEFNTNVASASSSASVFSSLIVVSKSNLDRIGSVKSTLSLKFLFDWYTPPIGFAAAITEHLACNDVTIPALEIDIDYYSIASWIEVLSCSFILSNSSIKQIPLSASTNAPPSRTHSPVTGSLCTPAVKPTALAPLPVVYTTLW